MNISIWIKKVNQSATKGFIATLCALAVPAVDAHASPRAYQAEIIQENISKILSTFQSGESQLAVTFKEVDKPFSGRLAEGIPRFSKDSSKYELDIQVPPGGLKNAFVLRDIKKELARFGYSEPGIFNQQNFEKAREMWFEATHGSAYARLIRHSKKIYQEWFPQFSFFDQAVLNSELMNHATDYFRMKKIPMPQNVTDHREILKLIQEQEKAAEKIAWESLLQQTTEDQKARLKEWENQKLTLKLMEKISEDKKFNDLVKANDRKGVRKMIEAFLPWPLMGLMEREAWKIWLEAIENPRPENSVLLFRGLDHKEHPQETTYQGKRSVGLFSTILNRNQGNYTRRLLSLGAKRSKRQSFLSPLFSDHAGDPKASQYISFSITPDVAVTFTEEGRELIVAKIDRRRAIPNHLGLTYEAEVLVPMVVFPDEIVSIEKRTGDQIDFREELKLKLVNLGLKNEIVPEGQTVFNRSREFFREIAVRAYGQIRIDRAPMNSCRRIFGMRQ